MNAIVTAATTVLLVLLTFGAVVVGMSCWRRPAHSVALSTFVLTAAGLTAVLMIGLQAAGGAGTSSEEQQISLLPPRTPSP